MIWIPIVLVVIIFLVVLLLKGQTAPAKGEYKKGEFLSPAEKDFLKALDSALGLKYRVFAKVRLADIITPLPGDKWQTRFNKINAKHVDFLLCGLTNGEPSCAVELDDRTHTANSRVERDGFIDRALKEAGVPVARFPVSRNYVGAEIMASVEAAIVGVRQTAAVPKSVVAPLPAMSPKPLQAPSCPKCGKQMVARKAQTGANAGHSFWGCPAYPACKGIVSII